MQDETHKYRFPFSFIERFKAKKLLRNYKQIPIFIISYNRLTYLEQIITYFESRGYTNINIIDNCSTYAPLLAYLEKSPYKCYRMDKNLGHMVFWISKKFKKFRKNNFFALTDPDIIPSKNCPDNFVKNFLETLLTHDNCNKVGFSLKIDDLPEDNQLKKIILEWEKQFYEKKYSEQSPILYNADIDTTFAVYRPQKKKINFFKAIRVGYPYQAHHLPWYKNLEKLSSEDIFYKESLNKETGTWNGQYSAEELKNKITNTN